MTERYLLTAAEAAASAIKFQPKKNLSKFI